MEQSDVGQIIWFTLLTAGIATLCLLPLGLAIAYLLARRRFAGRTLIETLVTLPLVLPPVATGLFLLQSFSRRSAIGSFLHRIHADVVFTWRGVVMAMIVMAAPLLIRSARVALEQVDRRLEDMARTLGASEWRVFLTVTLPLSARGVASGVVLAFARCIGEFGATVLVAGNIPGETTVLSVAIYDAVQNGADDRARMFALIAVIIAFAAVWSSEALTRGARRW